METIAATEVEAHFAELLRRVALGEAFTITNHGEPVALLSPPPPVDQQRRRQALEQLRTFGKGRVLGLHWQELRNEGRRY